MTEKLANQTCKPCREYGSTLKGDDLKKPHAKLGDGWTVFNGHHLLKEYTFDDFRQALDFTNRVGGLAEEVGHHATITLMWSLAEVCVYTHNIEGLSEADFIFAAKTDERT